MKKRVISIILSVIMLMSLVPMSLVFAATSTTIIVSADKTSAYPDDVVKFTISIGTVEHLMGAEFKVAIPAGMTYISESASVADGLKTTIGCAAADWTDSSMKFTIYGDGDYSSDGKTTILTFSCKIDSNAVGSVVPQITDVVLSDTEFEEITTQINYDEGTVAISQHPISVTGISLNKETISLNKGASETLIATVSPDNATNKTVKWESSDTSVATVDNNGKVTALKKGTATITVTTEDGEFTATCDVSVNCSHANTTVHPAVASTCQVQGNDEYTTCDDCGLVISGSDAKLPLADHAYTEKVESQYLKSAATCVSKAVYYKSCSVCGVKSTETFEYGEVDPSNHKHTEVREAKDATCCEAGYTGNTWCTDCNTKIATSTVIPATGKHVDVDGKWETDGTNHWHTCYFGTKFDVTAHSGGEATCVKQAECSVCGHSYGELDLTNHKATTYVKDQKEATCYEEGYTGDTYCSDCDVKIKDGTVIEKSDHNPASVWGTDETDHWKVCQTVGCGNLIDKAPHSGGEATCVTKAVCSVCGVQYGEVNVSNHKHTEVRDAKEATCSEAGYTGDTWCLDCNQMIAKGEEIDKLEHKLVLVNSEEATAAKEGNIKYYYCENCGKYYSDEAGTKEITKEDTVVSKLAPKIIDGNNAKIDKASKEPVSFRSDAAFADFIRVELDGKELVKDKDYTLKEGSIIVTLTPEFTATLTAGEHTLGIVSASGTAVASFTVTADNASNTVSDNASDNNSEKSPQTGDNSNIILWSIVAVISLAVLCTTAIVSKKKKVR